MQISEKINNPIKIRIKSGSSAILFDSNNLLETSLKTGVLFSREHYGFVIITDHNNNQKEVIYQTQCKVKAIDIKNGKLRIYEEHKKTPWVINQNTGTLETSAYDEFILEDLEDIIAELEDSDISLAKPIFKKPIKIEIDVDLPEKSIIIIDEEKNIKAPLYPGVFLSQAHYGFKLIIMSRKGQKELTIPTENKIEAFGQEDHIYGNIQIFEEGKYHPWRFSLEGNLIQEAHYNEYSKRDKKPIFEKQKGNKI